VKHTNTKQLNIYTKDINGAFAVLL